MLGPDSRIAIYMDKHLGQRAGKMGYGVLRYSAHDIVCVVDSEHAGRDVTDVIETPRSCPVVRDVRLAAEMGATALLLGIAPPGGRIPDAWLDDIDEAVGLGMSIVNGLHDHLGGRYKALAPGQWIWDIRREPDDICIADGSARAMSNQRVLLVGTDMVIGKMTAGLELNAGALRRSVKSAFLATGQIGIAITGRGVALDAVRLDYAAGAIQSLVTSAGDADLVFVEGQGSILHPASSAALPLARGTCPTDLILCHRAGQGELASHPWCKIPPLGEVMSFYQDLCDACGAYPRPRAVGIALDTSRLPSDEAAQCVEQTEAKTLLPTTDVVRFGADKLLDALLAR